MLRLNRIKDVGNIILSRPYMNSEVAVLTLAEAELRGKLFAGVRKHPRLGEDDTELIIFMKQDSETRLNTFLRQTSSGWNTPHTGIFEFDGVKRATKFGEVVINQFRWRYFGNGALQTRQEVKERLLSLGLNPQAVDCVFPLTEVDRRL